MELYTQVSFEIGRLITRSYSTSFWKSTTLIHPRLVDSIAAIYGMVRIADEVVDTYAGEYADAVITEFEAEVYTAMKRGYSTNPAVHAFALTAAKYDIGEALVRPFFASMHTDLTAKRFTQDEYEAYIYGSAEVIGLMCLKVFCEGDTQKYQELEAGAKALGAAYQKVNFLRDMREDYDQLGRVYFPGIEFETFTDSQKQVIVADIQNDISLAQDSLKKLPVTCRGAVTLSLELYELLLEKLQKASVEAIKTRRIRVSDAKKVQLFAKAKLTRKLWRDA